MLVVEGKEYELAPSGPVGSGTTSIATTTPVAEESKKEKPADNIEKKEGKRKNRGIPGTRWSAVLMLLLWGICIVFRQVHSIEWTNTDCEDMIENSGNADDDALFTACASHSAIYRVTTVAVVMLILQTVLTIIWSVDMFDYWWVVKFPVVALFSFALLYPPGVDGFDDTGFMWVARIGGFAFIIFQQLILLDWAYSFNASMLDRAAEAARRVANAASGGSALSQTHLMFLLVFSFTNISAFVTAMGLMFHYFGGRACPDNVTIISISMAAMLVAAIIQLMGTNGSIITTSILSLYVAYLSYTAVSLNPNIQCNSSLASNDSQWTYGLGPVVIGIVLSFISILWVSVVTSRQITNLMSAGPLPFVGLLSVIVGRNSGAESGGITGPDVDFKGKLRTSVMNLNVIYVLIAFYISMIMTNWGTVVLLDDNSKMGSTPSAGSTSMWMQAVGAWIAIALYVVSLLIPSFKTCLPTSVWDLQFNSV